LVLNLEIAETANQQNLEWLKWFNILCRLGLSLQKQLRPITGHFQQYPPTIAIRLENTFTNTKKPGIAGLFFHHQFYS
jgi:hypothetical protein